VQPVLDGGDDPRLVSPAEGEGPLGVPGRRRVVAGATGDEGAGEPGGGRATADQSTPGDPRAQESTTAVSLESGSASAFTAPASRLTSCFESLS
jgi:hypothetical protein